MTVYVPVTPIAPRRAGRAGPACCCSCRSRGRDGRGRCQYCPRSRPQRDMGLSPLHGSSAIRVIHLEKADEVGDSTRNLLDMGLLSGQFSPDSGPNGLSWITLHANSGRARFTDTRRSAVGPPANISGATCVAIGTSSGIFSEKYSGLP
jgi:hypothetical protein